MIFFFKVALIRLSLHALG